MSMNMCELSVTIIHLKIETFLIKRANKRRERKREKRKKERSGKLKTLGESSLLHLPVFWVLKSFHFPCNLGAESPSGAPETSEGREPDGEETVSSIPLAICTYLSLIFDYCNFQFDNQRF